MLEAALTGRLSAAAAARRAAELVGAITGLLVLDEKRRPEPIDSPERFDIRG